ncbi:PIN domain-containing protein [Candidatus Micrarchaeota archaeon]|nr:PIN domain-containing protein [Candidatus Micrarchaeota archaeon]
MLVLDTSLIISFFNNSDVFHSQAVEKFKNFEKDKKRLLVTNYVLNEAVTVMLRKANLTKSKELLEFLLEYKNMEIFHIDADGFMEVVKTFKNQKSYLSFTDCSLLWMAKYYGFKIETFDKNLDSELEKLAGRKRSRR